MQGCLPDTSNFLVSGLPSRLFFSEAILEQDTAVGASIRPTASISGRELLPPKTQQALTAFLRVYDRDVDNAMEGGRLSIRLHSNIPAAKGLSSSSTDILSVLSVVNDYLKAGCSTEDLYRFAAGVEPTDPCLSQGIVLFRQDTGLTDAHIALPPMDIVYFDAEPGRRINTLDLERHHTTGAGKFFDWLLRRFLRAAEAGDYEVLFDSISYSAEYNQTVIALPRFDEYLRLARETASGLMVAHSGTIMGLLTRTKATGDLLAKLTTATCGPVYSEQYSSSLFDL